MLQYPESVLNTIARWKKKVYPQDEMSQGQGEYDFYDNIDMISLTLFRSFVGVRSFSIMGANLEPGVISGDINSSHLTLPHLRVIPTIFYKNYIFSNHEVNSGLKIIP